MLIPGSYNMGRFVFTERRKRGRGRGIDRHAYTQRAPGEKCVVYIKMNTRLFQFPHTISFIPPPTSVLCHL